MSPWRVDEYRTAAGRSPIRDFIDGLDEEVEADALALIKLAEAFGNRLREPHSKALGGDSLSSAGTKCGSSTCSSPAGLSGC